MGHQVRMARTSSGDTNRKRYQDRPKQRGQKRGHEGDWPPVEIVVLKSTDCGAPGLHSNYIILIERSSLSPGGILDLLKDRGMTPRNRLRRARSALKLY